MRATLLRLTTPAQHLTAGAPTGLTGLLTHPNPRAELITLYLATLSKLKTLPANSAYRASTEALTSHRLSLVQSTKPAGWDEWNSKAQEVLQKHPKLFTREDRRRRFVRREIDGKSFVAERLVRVIDEDTELEWGGEKQVVEAEGTTVDRDLSELTTLRDVDIGGPEEGTEEWVAEPKLNTEEISELEDKIGAGLIEEVIEVADGELKLVNTMLQNKVWEELQDKPAPGQWEYFKRDNYVSGTQEPPK